jgi:hypothetical protein
MDFLRQLFASAHAKTNSVISDWAHRWKQREEYAKELQAGNVPGQYVTL